MGVSKLTVLANSIFEFGVIRMMLVFEFANTIKTDSKTHDFVRFSANISEQQVLSVSALEPLHQSVSTHKKSQGREHPSTAIIGYKYC
jgi:hypothetical protein